MFLLKMTNIPNPNPFEGEGAGEIKKYLKAYEQSREGAGEIKKYIKAYEQSSWGYPSNYQIPLYPSGETREYIELMERNLEEHGKKLEKLPSKF